MIRLGGPLRDTAILPEDSATQLMWILILGRVRGRGSRVTSCLQCDSSQPIAGHGPAWRRVLHRVGSVSIGPLDRRHGRLMHVLKLHSFAHSHQGLVRGNNEDSGFAGPSLLVVTDGVGGSAAGEVASASTAYVMAWFAMRPELVEDPADTLRQATETAAAHLSDGLRADPSRDGMATTLTAVLGNGNEFALAHIGDSRCYLLRDEAMTQITRDDSLVQDLLDAGDIEPHEVASHPYRSFVVKSVTADMPPDPEIVRLDLQLGDRLLLCSDGLSDVVSHDLIAQTLAYGSPPQAARQLVDRALAAGGPDNVTCVVADVELGEWRNPVGHLVGALRHFPRNVIDAGATFAPTY